MFRVTCYLFFVNFVPFVVVFDCISFVLLLGLQGFKCYI